MARIEMSDGWEENLSAPTGMLLEKLCSAVASDARMVVPVDTGDLKASLSHEVHGNVGRVGSNLDYAAAVELGFHGVEHVREYRRRDGTTVRAHERHANQPSEPYLRPALYVKRSAR